VSGDGDADPGAGADTDSGVATDSDASGDAASAACDPANAAGHFQMENLDRGLVAVRSGDGNYIGWRLMGYEYNRGHPSAIFFNLYRDGEFAAKITDSTNYQDSNASPTASYAVAAVVDGVECERSSTVTPWSQNYLRIPISKPDAQYHANDGSTGDLDGDGVLDIVLKWEGQSYDNSQSGFADVVFLDGIKLDGSRLWRIDLGPNIRSGAHYTQFVVYDFDGDGYAEVAMKTAPGSRDGTGNYLSKGPASSDDDSVDYRNSEGYVLSGPEYLTVFDGQTGAELDTVAFEVARGSVSAWGDKYGNRVDRFLASAGFVSDTGGPGQGSGAPSILMARGYYTRATLSAWTWRNGRLSNLWIGDSNNPGDGDLAGQGAHSMAVADVDRDKAQEIVYGAATWESDGSLKCSTGLGHGDALHVSDFDPSRPGLEVFMPHEDSSMPIWDVHDGATCSILQASRSSGSDNGRGVAADIVAGNRAAEFWSSADAVPRSCDTGDGVGDNVRPKNFVIWWDADVIRELEDKTSINKYDGGQLLEATGCSSNNGTKSTPTLTADLLGDWREEIIWRESDDSALRLYTTTDVTDIRIYTLMHDPQYRMQVSAEQTAYNQPPHPGFFIGEGMALPPVPDIHVR
jgi:hypothetical protein